MLIQIVENWFHDYYDYRRGGSARQSRGRQEPSEDKYGGSYDDLDEKPAWNSRRGK